MRGLNAEIESRLRPSISEMAKKVHVPANFVGYGTFALAAMLAFAYLIKQSAGEARWYRLGYVKNDDA